MRIASFQINNYKSFLSTEETQLSREFNVIVGQNNAGKTALLEIVGLHFSSKPHRSQKTILSRGDVPDSRSLIDICFVLDPDELRSILISHFPKFYVQTENLQHTEYYARQFIETISEDE